MSTDKYGQKYWYARLATGDEVHFHADELTVTEAGALVGSTDQKGTRVVMFAVGPGQWHCAYAASVMDGGAVAVDHWEASTKRPGARRRKE